MIPAPDFLDLRGLSLRQPYADLMALGAKRVETRGRDIGAQPGQLVAIHASLVAYDHEECPGAWDVLGRHVGEQVRVAVGVIVAVGRVVSVAKGLRIDHGSDPSAICLRGDVRALERVCAGRWTEEQTCGNWGAGRFLIVCDRLPRLRNPVPCRGSLGLWRVPPDVVAAVRREMA